MFSSLQVLSRNASAIRILALTGALLVTSLLPCASFADQATALEQLQGFSRRDRVQGLKYFEKHPDEVPLDMYPAIVGMLDDSLRVVFMNELGEREVLTGGKVARRVIRNLNSNILSELTVSLVEHRPSIRWRCAQLLGELKSPDSLDVLSGALVEDPDRLVRISAADAMVQLGPTALPRAMELLRHENPDVRRQAIYVASRLGDDRIIEPLLQLATTGDQQDSIQARQALLEMGQQIVAPILNLIESDSPRPVKARAIGMAGRLRVVSAQEALMFIILTHQDEFIRTVALNALQASGLNELTFHTVLNLLADPNPQISRRAPTILQSYPPRVLEQILFYIDNTTPTMQVYAMKALLAIGVKANPLITRIIKMQGVSKANKRALAMQLKRSAFYGVQEEDRLDCLELLQDWATLAAIGPGIEQRFQRLYRSEDPNERRGALRYYTTSGNIIHHPYLVNALDDDAEFVRTLAVDAVYFASSEILDELRKQLGRGVGPKSKTIASLLRAKRYQPRSEIEQLQIAAAVGDWQAVARLGDAALTYLVEMLQSDDPEIVIWAAKTLADFHTNIGLQSYNLLALDPTLYEAMRVGGNRDNAPTINTLLSIRDHRSTGYLFCAWYCEDEDTRAASERALKKAGGAWRELLKEALKVTDPELRKETIQLVGATGAAQFDLLLPLIDNFEYFETVQEVLAANDYVPESKENRLKYLMGVSAYDQVVEMGAPGIDHLLQVAFDEPGRRPFILRTLGRTKQSTLVPHYLLYMSDLNPAVVQAARYAMDQIDGNIEEQLIAFVNGGNITLARNAGAWLKKRGYTPTTDVEKAWLAAVTQDWNQITEMGESFKDLARNNLLSPQINHRAISAASLAGARELHLFKSRQAAQAQIQQGAQGRSLTNDVPEIRAVAAASIARSTNVTQYIPDLMAMLEEDMDLGRTTARLVTFKGRRTPGIQAAVALGSMGEATYTNLLRVARADPESVAARNARIALAFITNSIAHEVQMEFVAGKDEEMATIAAGSLSLRKEEKALPYLVALAIDPDNPTRHRVKGMLVNYGDAAISSIIAAGSISEREDAIPDILTLIGLLRSPETVSFLSTYAAEGKIQHRRLAFEVLGRIGGEAAARMLLAQTLDPLWLVRETAAGELQRLGPVAIPLLLDAMETPELAGKGYPLKLLQQITGVDYEDDLDGWRNWWTKKSAQAEPKSAGSLDTATDTP